VSTALEHHELTTNGVRLHVVQAGPPEGEIALLLHGFPEFWMGWAGQIDALAAAGFRVWIPDQRGYNTSDKPSGVDAYSIDVLVEDIRGLIAQAGRRQVVLLGHDWGGAVAWLLAHRYPELVSRLVIVNSPHFSVMKHKLQTDRAQRRRSWYMLFFRLPVAPELVLRFARYALLAKALRSTSRPGTFSEEKLARYREAWRQPRALTAMLNWYRAIFRPGKRRVADPRISVPTLLIWGTRDTALGADMAQPSIDLCDAGSLVLLDTAGHWVLHEEPARVSALIRSFLS
jgi:epoxide hydrolase 4